MVKIKSISYCLSVTEAEKRLQDRLSSISKQQLDDDQDLLNIKDAAADIKLQHQTYKTKVGEVQKLIEEMKVQLEKAKSDLKFAVRLHADRCRDEHILSCLTESLFYFRGLCCIWVCVCVYLEATGKGLEKTRNFGKTEADKLATMFSCLTSVYFSGCTSKRLSAGFKRPVFTGDDGYQAG